MPGPGSVSSWPDPGPDPFHFCCWGFGLWLGLVVLGLLGYRVVGFCCCWAIVGYWFPGVVPYISGYLSVRFAKLMRGSIRLG